MRLDCLVLTKIVNQTFHLKPDCPVKNRTCGNPICLVGRRLLNVDAYVTFLSNWL